MNAQTGLNQIVQQINSNANSELIPVLEEQLTLFEDQYKGNRELTPLLKMMRSLTDYLLSKKSMAHPDTFPVLESLSRQLDTLCSGETVPGKSMEAAVSEQMNLFRQFQDKLASRPPVSPAEIEELKEVILSIDWEISNTTINDFERVIKEQLEKFKPYKIHHTLLKIIYSTGRYVAAQKARAHTDSISFLRSVFNNFEKLIITPDISALEKKKLLEADINRFRQFKQTVFSKDTHPVEFSRPETTPAPEPEPEEEAEDFDGDPIDEDVFSPALSHVKKENLDSAADQMVTLDKIPDASDETLPAANAMDFGTAASNSTVHQGQSKDVMDDLFSIKESPADELLDAIHLMDVHGPDQGQQAMAMLDSTQAQSDGVKTFTAQRKDSDSPIPEIESRLDEFFNLDAPQAKAPAQPSQEKDTADIKEDEGEIPEIIPDMGDDPDGLIPFDYSEEDESLEQAQSGQAADTLDLILDGLDAPSEAHTRTNFDPVRRQLDHLRMLWETDDEKQRCILVMERLLDKIDPPERQQDHPEPESTDDSEITADGGQEKQGFWTKFTRLFRA